MKGALLLGCFAILVIATLAAPVSTNDVVPEKTANEIRAAHKYANLDPVVKRIIEVKSWCVLAAKNMKDSEWDPDASTGNVHKNAISMIIKRMSKKPKSGNIVTQFGEVIGHIQRKAMRGVSNYVLKSINESVLGGKSVFVRDGLHTILDSKVLGFSQTPDYFKSFRVNAVDFLAETHDLDNGDAAKAVAEWERKGRVAAYQANLKIAEGKIAVKEEKQAEIKQAAAVKAIEASFATTAASVGLNHKSSEGVKIAVMNPLFTAGLATANKVANTLPEVRTQTVEKMEQEAFDKAAGAIKKAARKQTVGGIVRELEAAVASPNQSTMDVWKKADLLKKVKNKVVNFVKKTARKAAGKAAGKATPKVQATPEAAPKLTDEQNRQHTDEQATAAQKDVPDPVFKNPDLGTKRHHIPNPLVAQKTKGERR